MTRPSRRGRQEDNRLRPAPANWPGRPRVRPSMPFGQQQVSDHPAGEQLDVAALYQRGEAARAHGDRTTALRCFERISALYAYLDDDPDVLSGQLAWALHRSGELMDTDGSRGPAAERYFAAAEVFERLAAALSTKGNKELADTAQAAAHNAQRRGTAAQAASNKAQERARALGQQRGMGTLRP
jgi:hypothetical protein